MGCSDPRGGAEPIRWARDAHVELGVWRAGATCGEGPKDHGSPGGGLPQGAARPQGTSAALLLGGAEAKLAEMLGDCARGP